MRIGKADAEKGIERKMSEVDREAVALARQQADPESDEYVNVGGGRPKGEETHDNVMSLSQGNGQSYTLRRLARERPDLLDQVEAGQLTANAAAIEAGFRTRKLQVELTPEAIQRLLNRQLPEWQLVNIQTGEAIEVDER